MSDANVRGRILWHELNTTDQKAAAAFYLKAVGWTTQAWDENPSYVMFAAGGRPMAGLLALGADAGGRPNWLYIGTPNLESTRQAQALGDPGRPRACPMGNVGREGPAGRCFAALSPRSRRRTPKRRAISRGASWRRPTRRLRSFYQQLAVGKRPRWTGSRPRHVTWEGRLADGRDHRSPPIRRLLRTCRRRRTGCRCPRDRRAEAPTRRRSRRQWPAGRWKCPAATVAIGIDPGAFAVHSQAGSSGGVDAIISGAKKSAAKSAKKTVKKAEERARRRR